MFNCRRLRKSLIVDSLKAVTEQCHCMVSYLEYNDDDDDDVATWDAAGGGAADDDNGDGEST